MPSRIHFSNRLAWLPLGLALSATACNPARVPDDELVVLIEQPAESPDPRYAVTAYDFKVGRLLFAPLVSVDDADTTPRMELAESVVARDPLTWAIAAWSC